MYRKRWEGWIKHIDFVFLDEICLFTAFAISHFIRFRDWELMISSDWAILYIMLFICDLGISAMVNSFKNVLKRGWRREAIATVKHVSLVTVSLCFLLFTAHVSYDYSRQVIFIWVVLYLFLSYLLRQAFKHYLIKREKKINSRSLFIYTTLDMAGEALEKALSGNLDHYEIKGLVIPAKNLPKEVNGVPVIGDEETALEYMCHTWVDEVMIVLPNGVKEATGFTSALREMGVTVHNVLMQRIENDGLDQFVNQIGEYTVVTTTLNAITAEQAVIKRCMDIAGGLVGTAITILLTVILGPVIFISDPGPIFFSQVRVGKNGKLFKVYKFRTMYKDAEERKKELMSRNAMDSSLMFKLKEDPRIIGSKILPNGKYRKGVGNLIRDFSLDEFPQFINVLFGSMSLVGTRPPTVEEYEQYKPWHRARLATKPGITGMWQVNGRSTITDFEDVVKQDMKYINNWTPYLDIGIMIKTVKVVLTRNGAM